MVPALFPLLLRAAVEGSAVRAPHPAVLAGRPTSWRRRRIEPERHSSSSRILASRPPPGPQPQCRRRSTGASSNESAATPVLRLARPHRSLQPARWLADLPGRGPRFPASYSPGPFLRWMPPSLVLTAPSWFRAESPVPREAAEVERPLCAADRRACASCRSRPPAAKSRSAATLRETPRPFGSDRRGPWREPAQ